MNKRSLGIMAALLVIPTFAGASAAEGGLVDPLHEPYVEPYSAVELVRGPDSSAVYVLRSDTRHVFPNGEVFLSYFDDFSDVALVSRDRLAQYGLGEPVLMAPGSLVKIQSDNRVYLIDSDGSRRHVETEEVARDLKGPNWAASVRDVPVTRLFDYWEGPIVDIDAVRQSSGGYSSPTWTNVAYPIMANDRTLGDIGRARVHMVVFGGYEDPFSVRLYGNLLTLREEYGSSDGD